MNHFEHDFSDQLRGDDRERMDGIGLLFGAGIVVVVVIIGCLISPWWL